MHRIITLTAIILSLFTFLSAQTWKYLNESNYALPSNSIRYIFFDDDQSVWLCTQDSGLIHLQNGVFHSFNSSTDDDFTADQVNAIVKSPANTYWIATE